MINRVLPLAMFSSLQSELKGFMRLQHYHPLPTNYEITEALLIVITTTTIIVIIVLFIIIIITGQNEGSGYLLVELTLDT